jgi:hypothetical protein
MIQGWMDHMAAADLGLNTLRCRLATRRGRAMVLAAAEGRGPR